MKYRVHFEGTASATVTVETDGPDEAIEAAYEELPTSLCIHCSGYAKTMYNDNAPSREWPDAMEPVELTDAEGETVWSQHQNLDDVKTQTVNARVELEQLKAGE